MSAFVVKTLTYEQQTANTEWNQKVLAHADGQEEGFKFDAQRFLDLFPADAKTDLLTPAAGATAVNQQLAVLAPPSLTLPSD
jgi:hypothetical protein